MNNPYDLEEKLLKYAEVFADFPAKSSRNADVGRVSMRIDGDTAATILGVFDVDDWNEMRPKTTFLGAFWVPEKFVAAHEKLLRKIKRIEIAMVFQEEMVLSSLKRIGGNYWGVERDVLG